MFNDFRELSAGVGPWAAILLYTFAWMWKQCLGADLRMAPSETAEPVSETQPREPALSPGRRFPVAGSSAELHA